MSGPSRNAVEKGKDRAPPPPHDEVIVVEDDTDSDAEFFTAAPVRRPPGIDHRVIGLTVAKGKRNVRASQRTQTARTETLPSTSHSTYVGSDDSESDDARRERARRKRMKNAPRLVPDWARESSLEARAETSRSQRARSNTATSRTSQEPHALASDRDSPRASRTLTRSRVELTPPPELDEEDKMRIKEQTRLLFQDPVDVDNVDDGTGDPASSPRRPEGRTKVLITVAMVADPDKKKTGSEAAVKHYERNRVFTLFHDDPLSTLIAALAQRVQKPPDQLVLVYGDTRIFSTERTPADLGIALSGEMRGYELEIYNKIQRIERRERLAQMDSGTDILRDESPPPADNGPVDDEPSAPAVAEEAKIKVRLQGASGNCLVKAAPHERATTLLRYFCTKTGLDPTLADKMKLCFDGEFFSGDTSLADMDVDGGDLIEVHGP